MRPVLILSKHLIKMFLYFLLIFLVSCAPKKWIPETTVESANEEELGEELGEEFEEPEEPLPPLDNDLDIFSEGEIVPDCLETFVNDANACIFGKNPVADEGQSLLNPPVINAGSVLSGKAFRFYGLTDVSFRQTHAVQIPGDKLKNKNFVIRSLDGAGVISRNANGDWKYPFHNDPDLSLVKINTFYWVNRLAQVIEDLIGNFYAEDKKITVVSVLAIKNFLNGSDFVVNAFWLKPFNLMAFGVSRHMGVDSNGKSTRIPIGLDAGIISHETGHAILDYASPAEIGFNLFLERNCGKSGLSFCSRTPVGSPRAIHEGVGDIMSIFLFPDSTPIGELFRNDPDGLNHCGLPRDVQEIKLDELTAQDLFNACPSTKGEIHALGSVYSTIWYGVFQRALERGGETEREDAYSLFFEHLKNVTIGDTFETLRQTIKVIDANLFSGQFSEDLDAEYELMGYDIQ